MTNKSGDKIPLSKDNPIIDLGKRKPFALYCDEPSLTVQAEKDECDINLILARVSKGADLKHVNDRVAKYGDFSNIPDYQTALHLVDRAQGFFMEMSPEVRKRFDNDPGKMVAFLQDPNNYDEAVKLGLVIPKKVEDPAPPETPVASKEATKPSAAPSGAA